jgi:hypothetical protein
VKARLRVGGDNLETVILCVAVRNYVGGERCEARKKFGRTKHESGTQNRHCWETTSAWIVDGE